MREMGVKPDDVVPFGGHRGTALPTVALPTGPSSGRELMLRRAAIAAIALTLLLPASAGAVWGGQPDGDDHPSVGAMYYDPDQDGEIEASR